MAKYRCNNKNCNLYDEIIEETNAWTRYKDGIRVDMVAPCTHCKEIREKIEEAEVDKGLCTKMYGSKNICNK